MSVIAYSHHMEYLLALEEFMESRWWYGTVSRHCLIEFEGVMWSSRSCLRPLFECDLCDV